MMEEKKKILAKEETLTKEEIKNFLTKFLESSKDDRIFKDAEGDGKFLYMSGFIKGILWANQQKNKIEGARELVEVDKKKFLDRLLKEKGGKRR